MIKFLDVSLDIKTVTALTRLLHEYVKSLPPDGSRETMIELAWVWHLVDQFEVSKPTPQTHRARYHFQQLMLGQIGSAAYEDATRSRKLIWRQELGSALRRSSGGSAERCSPPGATKPCCRLCSGVCCAHRHGPPAPEGE
jgi:hypothetical protein